MINTPKLTGKFGGAECPVIYVVLIKYQQCVCVFTPWPPSPPWAYFNCQMTA